MFPHHLAFNAPIKVSPSKYCQTIWYEKLEWCGYPIYSVSQKFLPPPPPRFSKIFPKRLRIFNKNFTRLNFTRLNFTRLNKILQFSVSMNE